MKKIIIPSLIIIIGSLSFLGFQYIETLPTRNQTIIVTPLPVANPQVSATRTVVPQITTKIYFQQTSPSILQLSANSQGQKGDTLQLIFKDQGKTVSDFNSSANSPMILRVKMIKDNQVVLLFSTNGEPILLDQNRSLGNFVLNSGANINNLLYDPARSKLILKGENFPVLVEGLK